MGIYDVPLKSALKPYRKGADVIEVSKIDYVILSPTWFTRANEVDYETTKKGQPEKGSVVSQKSLAAFIQRLSNHLKSTFGKSWHRQTQFVVLVDDRC